jgi:hypothetical protein
MLSHAVTKFINVARYVGLGFFATLAACNGASTQFPHLATGVPASHARLQQYNRSWIKPGAKGQRLLYISDTENGDVYVYGTGNTLLGTLTGFRHPLGECVDLANNIWIVDSGNDEVVEFSHGGTKPIAAISVEGAADADSCSVDPVTGDVAVGVRNFTSSPGWIMICSTPSDCTEYRHSAVSYVYFLSYDKYGNLYVDGLDRGGFHFAMVVRSNGRFQQITIQGATINSPGALVNKDGVLSLGGGQGASGDSIIYQVDPTGMVTGTTQLLGANGCSQFAVSGSLKHTRVTCPNGSAGNVTKYKYPSGGSPIMTISGPFTAPFAAVYSNP